MSTPGYGTIRGYVCVHNQFVATGFKRDGTQWTQYRVLRVDCYGRGMPGDDSYYLATTSGPPNPGWVDLRTLKELQAGCCPPQLLAEFMGPID